jgi:glutamate racemase
MLRTAIERFFGPGCTVVDSADATATQVRRLLACNKALSAGSETGRLLCYVSDNPQRFQAVGSHFLGETIKDVVRVCTDELCNDQDFVMPTPQRLTA